MVKLFVLVPAVLTLCVGCAAAPMQSTVDSCPWRDSAADRFDGPLQSDEAGFGSRVVATGDRDSLTAVADLLRQASACGWDASLASANKTEQGVSFEIVLVR